MEACGLQLKFYLRWMKAELKGQAGSSHLQQLCLSLEHMEVVSENWLPQITNHFCFVLCVERLPGNHFNHYHCCFCRF